VLHMKYMTTKCQQIARRPETENLWGAREKQYRQTKYGVTGESYSCGKGNNIFYRFAC